MRLFFIIILLLFFCIVHAQKKDCGFDLDSVVNITHTNILSLTNELKAAKLETVNKKRRIPKFIRQRLDCWTTKFDIANPNHRYQSGDVVDWRIIPLPSRQLTYLGLGENYCVITYKKGGKATSDHILIFRFENKKIANCWRSGNARITSKDELIAFLKNYKELPDSNNLL